MSLRSAELVKTEIVEGPRAFADLEQAWEGLYDHSPLATPFQSWAWLYSWWESYGDGYELRLITVRNGEGLLVGVLPLMLKRRWGFGRLLFIGTGQTDYLDVIAREGWEEEVAGAGVTALGQLGTWQVADLHQLRPEAAAWAIFRKWNRLRLCIRQASCPVINVEPWDELVGSLSRNLRSTVRRAVRRVETDGILRQVAKPSEAERAARRLVTLHREAWQGRDIGLEHLTRRFESHIVAAARRMTRRGLGGVSELSRDGEVVISNFWVSGNDVFAPYILGASQAALQRYQWSSLYIWDSVLNALDRNCATVDLLRGEEPYKLRWSSRIIPSYRVYLGRNTPAWALYTAYHILRSEIVRFEQAERVPKWMKIPIRMVGRLKRRGRW